MPHVLGIRGAIDMIDEPKLAESSIEEGTPGIEGSVAVVEGDWHMGLRRLIPYRE
jgi:hypothetical protein